ncbi:MAG: hypothetical protein AAF566_13320 [Pseudomonadota bacterium]
MTDKHHIPHFGETLALCLEVCGYRMSPGTTAHSLGREIFGCAASGLTKRFIGETAVTSAELSSIVARLGLDADGIFPDHLHLDPATLREKMEAEHVGIFGRSANTRLLRSVQAFDADPLHPSIKREPRRGPAFATAPDSLRHDPSLLFRPGEQVRFICPSPDDGWLVLIDFASDSGEAFLLSPRDVNEWSRPAAERDHIFPDPLEPPLTVMHEEGNRHLIALWPRAEFACEFDEGLIGPRRSNLRSEPDPPEFRKLRPSDIQELIEVLGSGPDGPIRFVGWATYRIDGL